MKDGEKQEKVSFNFKKGYKMTNQARKKRSLKRKQEQQNYQAIEKRKKSREKNRTADIKNYENSFNLFLQPFFLL